ncbi:MAG: sensor histidine kinase [Chloroflexota bacterium]
MELFKKAWVGIRRHPTITDGVIALILAVLALLNLWINWRLSQPVHLGLAVGLTLIIILPLTLRRRFPLALLLVMTALLVLYRNLDIPEGSFTAYALILALFSAGAYGNRRWRNWARSVSMAVVTVSLAHLVFFANTSFRMDAVLSQLLILLVNLFLFGAAWWVGDIMRTRRERELELKERTVQLEHEREENARRAVLSERVRIARELHDVVAHHVSVMGVQAGAARRILSRQPEKAQEALSIIETSSRQAVDELHRLLGFLRQGSQADGLAPQPGLRQIDVLVNEMGEAGLPVEVKIEGEERLLPPSVDLSAYRIVQEALTNTIKHAGPAKATVTVRYTAKAVELEILDDGRGPVLANGTELSGNGLVGMRERASLHGGEFEASRVSGGGFYVRAKLPLGGGLS